MRDFHKYDYDIIVMTRFDKLLTTTFGYDPFPQATSKLLKE
jgi:hypothetical protein